MSMRKPDGCSSTNIMVLIKRLRWGLALIVAIACCYVADCVVHRAIPVWSMASWPPDWEHALKQVSPDARKKIHNIKVYSKCRIIDAEDLCKASGAQDLYEILVNDSRAQPVNKANVSAEFFAAWPWLSKPWSSAEKCKFAMTPGFFDSPSQEGYYVFVMLDEQNDVIYVWMKDNF